MQPPLFRQTISPHLARTLEKALILPPAMGSKKRRAGWITSITVYLPEFKLNKRSKRFEGPLDSLIRAYCVLTYLLNGTPPLMSDGAREIVDAILPAGAVCHADGSWSPDGEPCDYVFVKEMNDANNN